jgi:Zn-dependent protease
MGVAAIMDLTLQQLGLRLVAFVFVATVHGVTVAAAAVAMGDQGPRHDGRLTLNPLAHLDLVGTVCAMLFPVGWIKPVAIDPFALRTGRIGLAIVVAAGTAATLLSAVALGLARPFILPLLPDTASTTAFALIDFVIALSVWFALVNVLPLPPLTGAHLLAIAAPAYHKVLTRIAPYAGLVLAVAAWSGIVTTALRPAYRILAPLIGAPQLLIY